MRINMKTNEQRRRSMTRIAIPAFYLALLALACGGKSTAPNIGSESHFLAHCDATCDDGLSCIGGICTRSCLTAVTGCSDLGSTATCTNQSVEPGQVAVCDVSCASGGDCQSLGAGYGCEGGFCRHSPDAVSTGNTPDVDCRPVGRYEVGKEGGYLPCCAGLTQLATQSEATVNNEVRACVQEPLNSYSCIAGTCGDGVCEEAEAPCGCGVDCPDSLWRAAEFQCVAYADQTPPPDIRVISITNDTPAPYYIQPFSLSCDASSLVQVERDGETVNVQSGGCAKSCQTAMDQGWNSESQGSTDISCPDTPCQFAPVLIAPGQTLEQSLGLEVAFQTMIRGCAEGIRQDSVNCYARVIPQPGNYEVSLRASATLDCIAGSTDCECRPDARGACTNRNVQVSGAPIVASWTGQNYYENHTLDIPGQ